jgi:exopolysaccharide production protein ExoQ
VGRSRSVEPGTDRVEYHSALDGVRVVSFVLLLLTAASAFDPLIIQDSVRYELSASNPRRLLLLLLLYSVFIGFSLLKDADTVLHSVLYDWLVVALLLLPLLSVMWSVDGSTSFRRAIALALTVVTCKIAVTTFTRTELEQMLRFFVIVFLLEAYLFIALSPSAIVSDGRKAGLWMGMIEGNTRFGRYIAIAALIELAFVGARSRLRALDVILLLAAVLALYKSGAKTALLSFLFAVGIYVALAFFRRLRCPSAVSVAIVAAIGLLALPFVLSFIEQLFALIQRDPTLTHRTRLWDLAVEYALQEHPILGAGFRAFWIEGHSTPVQYELFGSYTTGFGNGHNGYLDVWLELGVAGIMLLLVLMVSFWTNANRAYDRMPVALATLAVLLFYFGALYSTAENFLFEHSEVLSIIWLLCLFWSRLPFNNWSDLRWHTPTLGRQVGLHHSVPPSPAGDIAAVRRRPGLPGPPSGST